MSKKAIIWGERYWTVIVVATGGVAAGLALLLSIGQSIWFDEGYSILLAREPVGELLSLTAVDAHPPLYYLLLKLWSELFGFGELALRSLSAIALGGSVSMMLVLLRHLFGTRVALMSIPMIVLAPFALRYGYEIRMYALASLIGVVATYALVCAKETKRNVWWGLYAVLVALGMYTLYMMAAVWIAHVVWLLWTSLRGKRKPFSQWQWPYAYLGAVAVFVPYMPTFFHQLFNSALPGIGHVVTMTSIVDITTMISLYTAEWAMGGWSSLVLVVLATALVVMAVRVYRILPATQLPGFVLMLVLVLVPIAFFAIISLPPRAPVYVVRYIAHISLFMYALIAVAVGMFYTRTKSPRHAVVVYIGVVIMLGVGVGNLGRTGNFNFERMQQPYTAELRRAVECADDTAIVADDPYTYIDNVFYYDGCDVRFFSQDIVARTGGYAMLHNSDARIASADDISDKKRIVHLRWVGNEAKFTPGETYHLVGSANMDKQLVEIYELSAE